MGTDAVSVLREAANGLWTPMIYADSPEEYDNQFRLPFGLVARAPPLSREKNTKRSKTVKEAIY